MRGISNMTKPRRLLVLFFLLIALCGGFTKMSAQSFRPKDGFVPNEKAAVRIAEAVLSPIYGDEKIVSERPFSAKLKGDVWTVTGSLPGGMAGGVAEVRISKRTGEILDVTHGK
jgi:hypothetical protein